MGKDSSGYSDSGPDPNSSGDEADPDLAGKPTPRTQRPRQRLAKKPRKPTPRTQQRHPPPARKLHKAPVPPRSATRRLRNTPRRAKLQKSEHNPIWTHIVKGIVAIFKVFSLEKIIITALVVLGPIVIASLGLAHETSTSPDHVAPTYSTSCTTSEGF